MKLLRSDGTVCVGVKLIFWTNNVRIMFALRWAKLPIAIYCIHHFD